MSGQVSFAFSTSADARFGETRHRDLSRFTVRAPCSPRASGVSREIDSRSSPPLNASTRPATDLTETTAWLSSTADIDHVDSPSATSRISSSCASAARTGCPDPASTASAAIPQE